jgi:DNA-binding GntR family transcriptional regulator
MDILKELPDLKARVEDAGNVTDVVYKALRRGILAGDLSSRTKLREVELAKKLGVSRTPVREALSRLAGDQLIRRNTTGMEVADIVSERAGVRHIRLALEGYAARLAAERIAPDELDELERLVGISQALPYNAFRERVAINSSFHRLIYHASRVPQLAQAIENYAEYFITESEIGKIAPAEAKRGLNEHKGILEALRKRKGALAEKLVHEHLRNALNIH